MKDGVYLDLDEKTYHELDRISSHDMMNLNQSLAKYFYRKNNKTDSPALRKGRMFHKFILENKEFFNDYAIELQDFELDGALNTVNDLKNAIKNEGAVPKGKKEDLIQQILELKPETKIVEIIEKDFYEKNKGKEIIKTNEYEKLNKIYNNIKETEYFEYIENGLTEVSILWSRGENKYRARIDLIYNNQLDNKIIDLKTFSLSDKDPEERILKSILNYKYFFQMYIYKIALQYAQELPCFKDGKECNNPLISNKPYSTLLLFAEAEMGNIIRGVTTDNSSILQTKAYEMYEEALKGIKLLDIFTNDDYIDSKYIEINDKMIPNWF